MRIRPLRAGEGAKLRELRLRALRDAPQAFFHSLAAERAVPAEEWERWADDPEHDRIMFIAVDDGRDDSTDDSRDDGGDDDDGDEDGEWLGMAGCSLRGDSAGTLDATGMWVAPWARGRNIGERLIEAIVAWGRGRGAHVMEFAVTETNDVAIALYRRMGFVPTGRRRALASDPQLVGMFMAKSLDR